MASVLGGSAGASTLPRRLWGQRRTTVRREPSPLAPPREVYP
jgi:hypothetical protein